MPNQRCGTKLGEGESYSGVARTNGVFIRASEPKTERQNGGPTPHENVGLSEKEN